MKSMNNMQVTVWESWKLSYKNEVIAEIQHSLEGLLPGTILISKKSGLSWKVIARTIFIQAENQKRFKAEKEYFEHIKFWEPFEESFEKFMSYVKENEDKGIHQYSIEPLNHEKKPEKGEVLELESN
jgi:hypothetical protein